MAQKELKRGKVMRYIETRDEKIAGGKSWHLRTRKEKLSIVKADYDKIKTKKKEGFGNFFKRYDQTIMEGTEKEIRHLSKMTNAQLDLALAVMEEFRYQQFAEVQLIAIAEFNISNWIYDQIYGPYKDSESAAT